MKKELIDRHALLKATNTGMTIIEAAQAMIDAPIVDAVVVPSEQIVEDCEGRHDYYIQLDGIRLIVDEGEISGWYRPNEE